MKNESLCPIWQCGGTLKIRDSKSQNEEDSWQIPDLVCDNCRGVYIFKEFET